MKKRGHGYFGIHRNAVRICSCPTTGIRGWSSVQSYRQ